jgi:integrase
MESLKAIKRDRGVLSQLVFCTPEGKSLRTNFGRYWRAVLDKAQVPDFRFHDLRHTFASRLAMDGVDLYTVQRAGGWKTSVMVQRYAHLSPEHIRAAVERLAHRSVSGANGHQNGHQAATAGSRQTPTANISAG